MSVSGFCWREGCGHHAERHELVDLECADKLLDGSPIPEDCMTIRWAFKCHGLAVGPNGPTTCACHSFVMKEVPSGKAEQQGPAGTGG